MRVQENDVNMNEFAYLVVLSHGMDDMPIRLLADRDAAFELANKIDWEPPEHVMRLLELPDCNPPCVICVYTFRDGEPISRVIVRCYDEEESTEVG